MTITQKWCTIRGTPCDSYEEAKELETAEQELDSYAAIQEFIESFQSYEDIDFDSMIGNIKNKTEGAKGFVKAVNTLFNLPEAS